MPISHQTMQFFVSGAKILFGPRRRVFHSYATDR